MTFSDRVIDFNRTVEYRGDLPEGIKIMNPFKDSPETLLISSRFYEQFYNDTRNRVMILGINPGRHGAGITGIPFTDTKRIESHCGLSITGFKSHELSSVFVYDMIDACGGVRKFYNRYYINSVCPLGFVMLNNKGREINYNYYDDAGLFRMVKPFIVESIAAQISFGIDTNRAYCLGRGKNYRYLEAINDEERFFSEIIPLEHPRYIMQYKLKNKNLYINKYTEHLSY